MPKYLIEMDEPTTCDECACFFYEMDELQTAECQLAQRDVPATDPYTYDIPEWCPLEEVSDEFLDSYKLSQLEEKLKDGNFVELDEIESRR